MQHAASRAEAVFLEEAYAALQQGCPGTVASSRAKFQDATCKDPRSCLIDHPGREQG